MQCFPRVKLGNDGPSVLLRLFSITAIINSLDRCAKGRNGRYRAGLMRGFCCIDPVLDSLCASRMGGWLHEWTALSGPTRPGAGRPVEPSRRYRLDPDGAVCAQAPRLCDDPVRCCHDPASRADRHARRQPIHGTAAAIGACPTMKILFGLVLRQATGLVESLLQPAGADQAVPDFSTLGRRQIETRSWPQRGRTGQGRR